MHINLSPFPQLTTNRLILRKLQPNDSNDLLIIRSNEQVNKYLDRPGAVTIQDISAFINKIHGIIEAGEGVYWVLSLKDSTKVIGTICYWNFNPEKDMADIGYELLPDYQAKGLMQEAVAAVIAYGFNVMELKVISAVTHPDNESSANLLKRNNFKLDTGYQYISKEDADGQLVYVLMK